MRIVEVHSCDECPYYNGTKDFCEYSDVPILDLCTGNDGQFPEKCELTDPAIPRYRSHP